MLVNEPLKFYCSCVKERGQLPFVVLNTDISKYPLMSKNIVWTSFLFSFKFQLQPSQLRVQKIYSEILVVWVNFDFEILRVDCIIKRALFFLTVELQWLEHLWNHINMFEARVVGAYEC